MMKIHKSTRIQDPEDIKLICKLHAEGVSVPAIVEELKPKYGGKLYPRNIYTIINNKDNEPTIQKYREAYLSDPFAVALAHKRTRLEDLNRQRLSILNSIDQYVNKDGEIFEKKIGRYLKLSKVLVQILIATREEMEKRPDSLAMLPNTPGPYSEIPDEELRALDRELEKKIIAMRLAQKDKDLRESGEREP